MPTATVGWGSALSLCGCYRSETLLLSLLLRPRMYGRPLGSKVVSQTSCELGQYMGPPSFFPLTELLMSSTFSAKA